MRKHITEEPIIIFQRKPMKISEAGAMLMKHLIENELPIIPEFPDNYDPYEWLSSRLGRHKEAVRKWVHPWRTDSGAMPTVDTFFYLLHLTQAPICLEFIACLINYSDKGSLNKMGFLEQFAEEVIEMGEKLKNMVGKLKKDSKTSERSYVNMSEENF